jgi:hypothetical protein
MDVKKISYYIGSIFIVLNFLVSCRLWKILTINRKKKPELADNRPYLHYWWVF